jgi:hypothetical protein
MVDCKGLIRFETTILRLILLEIKWAGHTREIERRGPVARSRASYSRSRICTRGPVILTQVSVVFLGLLRANTGMPC